MKFDVVTLFPEFFDSPLACGILRIARQKGAIRIRMTNPRDYTPDGKVDDYQFGGGAGMVMKPEPVTRALKRKADKSRRVILFTPKGRPLRQDLVRELTRCKQLVLICGRYKGIDERVTALHEPLEISIGDYVLAGGEIAALALIEATARLLPKVMGDLDSAETDSLQNGLLEAPIYTRPAVYKKMEVPPVLRSGNHRAIADWRRRESLALTLRKRPDLMSEAIFSKNDLSILLEVLDGNQDARL
jgi:tRNA (guanine37-N1)-methyltransferase